jgi:hypothetical protein
VQRNIADFLTTASHSVVDGRRLTADDKLEFVRLYEAAAATLDDVECGNLLEAIRRSHPALHAYIMAVPLERWAASAVAARTARTGVPSFGISTSNHAGTVFCYRELERSLLLRVSPRWRW